METQGIERLEIDVTNYKCLTINTQRHRDSRANISNLDEFAPKDIGNLF